MTKTIFVRTRHHYVPYDDLFRLAELSGYPIIYVDEMQAHDAPDVTFIISPVNGEWNTRPKGYTQGRVILYMLEWNTDGSHNAPACADEIWCGDKWHSEVHGYRYVPLGSHPGLNEAWQYPAPEGDGKLYDVAFMGYTAPSRRAKLLQEMFTLGLRIAPNAWGRERSELLIRSNLMLFIHQFDNMPTIPPLRMCIAAAHKIPVISETVRDKGMFDGYLSIAPYDMLVTNVRLVVHNIPKAFHLTGESLYHLLCEDYTFRRSIESNL